jgi:hypothetical protein
MAIYQMNERIKKLYEQAHVERHQEYFSSEVDPTIKSVSVTRHFDLDLFTELIVKECSYLADQAHYKATNGKSAGGYIRQQFGVEE